MYLYHTFIVSSTSLCVANKLPACQQTLIPSRHVYRRPVAAHCCPPLSPPQWRHGTGVIWGKSESTSSGQTSCCFCPTVILNLPAHLALNRPWRAWEWEMKNGGGWRAEVLHPLFPYLFCLSVFHSHIYFTLSSLCFCLSRSFIKLLLWVYDYQQLSGSAKPVMCALRFLEALPLNRIYVHVEKLVLSLKLCWNCACVCLSVTRYVFTACLSALLSFSLTSSRSKSYPSPETAHGEKGHVL